MTAPALEGPTVGTGNHVGVGGAVPWAKRAIRPERTSI